MSPFASGELDVIDKQISSDPVHSVARVPPSTKSSSLSGMRCAVVCVSA